MKKKASKSKPAAGSMKNLPARPLKPKAAKGVKGGESGPAETVTFAYGRLGIKYTQQKP
jgi:hypothetical protein